MTDRDNARGAGQHAAAARLAAHALRAAASTCSIRHRRTSRSRTSRTGWHAWRAGTGRRWGSTPTRSPSTRCWLRRSPPPCSPISTRRWRLAALLHDAPEYVIGDLISPFKAAIGLDYKAFENKLLEAIHRRFALPPALPGRITMAIKAADRIAAFYEATQLAGFTETRGQSLLRRAARGAGLAARAPGEHRPRADCRCAGSVSGALRRAVAGVDFRPHFGTSTRQQKLEPILLRRGPMATKFQQPAIGPLDRAVKDGAVHVCPLSAVPHVVARQQRVPPPDVPPGRDSRRDAAADHCPIGTCVCTSTTSPSHARIHGSPARSTWASSSILRSIGAATGPWWCTAGPASAVPRLPRTRRCAPSIPRCPRS